MKMKKIWTAALCLGLLAALGGQRLAAADWTQTTTEQELKAKLASQGWKEISTGVYERQRTPEKFEHLGYGREGLIWTIGDLTRQHDSLLATYQRYPSEELHKVIDELAVKIAAAKRELRNTKSFAEYLDAYSTGCSICYGATADASALSGSSQGVSAVADANFSSSCGYSGDTYAYAYAQATLAGTTTTHTQSDPHSGTSVTSHASASVNGTSNCSSNANSYAQSTALGISYSTSTSHTGCPPPPPTITGPATASITGTSCQTLTWSATTNGGVSPFSYAWTIDGTAAGTSSSTSVSKTYCGNGTNHSQTVNVALTVTDSTSQSSSNSFSTAITYHAASPPTASITGPTSVSKFTGLCKSATWSGSASGGTTPYTAYSWTYDGSSVGTSSSLTLTFCPDDIETVNLCFAVTDSASQTGSACISVSVDVEGSTGCGGNPCP
jgi:hypothetical protein